MRTQHNLAIISLALWSITLGASSGAYLSAPDGPNSFWLFALATISTLMLALNAMRLWASRGRPPAKRERVPRARKNRGAHRA